MAVEQHREDFDDAKADWDRLRDVIAGQRAMQRNSEIYLRRPEGMTSNIEWNDYAEMVPFFEATGRTVDGLGGMAFVEDPAVDLPPSMGAIAEDITMDGITLESFAENVLSEVISVGRVGLMVDFPPEDPKIKTRRDEERANRRPFARIYRAEQAFNWRSGLVRNSRRLVEVRLLERELIADNEFSVEYEDRIRVLQLVGNDVDGWAYLQRVFIKEKEDGKSNWVEQAPVTPLIDGKALEYIPFWFVNPRDQTDALRKPPLLGLANTNCSHFNTSAQLERVLSFVGAPQLYITGLDDDDVTLTVGSADAWIIPNADAKVGYAACPPEGVEVLENRLNRFEQHMALLGARMLSADKKGVEAAETANIHRQGEVSVLASCCNSVSAAIRDVLRVMADWAVAGTLSKNSFAIDTAFFEGAIEPAEAVNLLKLWQGGAIGFTDLVDALKRGRIVNRNRTADDIQSENQSGPNQPILPGLTGPAPTVPTPAKRPTLTLPKA